VPHAALANGAAAPA